MHDNTSVLGRLFWQGVNEGFTDETLLLVDLYHACGWDRMASLVRQQRTLNENSVRALAMGILPARYDTYYYPSNALAQMICKPLTAEDFL